MLTRRQERVARVIKESVSDTIANHLSDPRISGFTSVTRVKISADLRSADVYLSIFGTDTTGQKKTFAAIEHAKSKVQSMLGRAMKSKFCPVIRFHQDENFKKTIETLNIIDQAASEIEEERPGINSEAQ